MPRFEDLRLAFEFVSYGRRGECEAYVRIADGAVFRRNEFGEPLDEFPDDIDDPGRYAAIPHKDALGLGEPLMLAFAYHHLPGDIEMVRSIFRQGHPYARFSELVERLGLLVSWHEFEDQACDDALRRWCRETGIAFSE